MSEIETPEKIKLTQYSHGAGCGCKIAPSVLDIILKNNETKGEYPNLLVGNNSRDDAAVYDMGNGMAMISTTDFFMPIVDDPFEFGRIAATNAISDVYAMGGIPNMAIAILGWPIDKLAPEIAGQVVAGGRKACHDAGIPLAGGHSIDCPEPVFGLAVNGLIETKNVKTNSAAQEGDLLFLTKSLGVGIITTASKRGIVSDADLDIATIRPGLSSHNYTWEIINGNTLRIRFINIYLPDMTHPNENKGYVCFSIRQKQGLQPGTVISNSAQIYFDFNVPVSTNTTINTIFNPLSISEISVPSFRIYPNPASDKITVNYNQRIAKLVIYNIYGQSVKIVRPGYALHEPGSQEIDISELASGIYFVSINDINSNGVKFMKLQQEH